MTTDKPAEKFVLYARHTDQKLHRSAKAAAAMEGMTLEKWVVKAVREAVARRGRSSEGSRPAPSVPTSSRSGKY